MNRIYRMILFITIFHRDSLYSQNIINEEKEYSDPESHIHSGWKEKELIQWILQDYDKRSRPVFDNVTRIIRNKDNDTIQQINVEFGLRLIHILDLNEMEQVLTTSVRLLYRWKDLHLEWDPTDFENIKFVFIPSNLIWIPDIALYNYADERLEERRPCAAKISSDGTVEWQPMAIYKSTCFVNIKYFPFDIQTCWLKFGPWTYDGFRVNITFYNNENFWDLNSLIPSPEWTIVHSWANHTEIRYPCCDEPYPDISFYVKIRRSSMFYTYILILPCFLLSSLTLVLFWMPPESPAKMVLGMNIFVAFFLMLLLLQDTTPSASRNFPLIGTYYCVNMGIITLSTFLSCIVVNLHFRGDNRQEVPYWLKKLIFKYAMRFLCINFGSNSFQKTIECISPTTENQSKPSIKKKVQQGTPKYLTCNYYEKDRKQTPPTDFPIKLTNEIDETSVASIQNWIKFNSFSEVKSIIQNESLNEQNRKPNNGKSSDSQFLQVPLSPNLFPQYLSNSDLYKTLESYSPLHSPILKKSFQFIDENKNNDTNNNSICNNRESLYSSTPLLQDALALSLSQLVDLKASLTPSHNQNESNILNKTDKTSKNTQTSNNDATLLGMSTEQHKRICNDVKVIVKSLKYIQKLQENKENVARIITEWRSVGLVLDRIFFYCYLFTVIFSIIMYFPQTNLEEE